MGGKPRRDTPYDRRLRTNKSKPPHGSATSGSPAALPAGFSDTPWDGSASNYDDVQDYANACLINLNAGPASGWTKANCKLPIYEVSPNDPKHGPPGDNPKHEVGPANVNAMHVAAAALAGGMGGVDAPPAAKKSAARKLKALYGQLGEPVPPSLKQMAM
jgi:hypothetical protein